MQADTFISERIVTKTCSINAPIRKDKFLFSAANTFLNQTISHKEKQVLIKKDILMFAQLYITTQVRGRDIQELFNQETTKEQHSFAKLELK